MESRIYEAPKGTCLQVTVTGIESVVGPTQYDDVENAEEIDSSLVKTFTKKKYRYHWVDKVEVFNNHVAVYRKGNFIAAIINGFGDIFIEIFDPEKQKKHGRSE